MEKSLAWRMCRRQLFGRAMPTGRQLQKRPHCAAVPAINSMIRACVDLCDWEVPWGPPHMLVNSHHCEEVLCLTMRSPPHPVLGCQAAHIHSRAGPSPGLSLWSLPDSHSWRSGTVPGASTCPGMSLQPYCHLDAQQDWPL